MFIKHIFEILWEHNIWRKSYSICYLTILLFINQNNYNDSSLHESSPESLAAVEVSIVWVFFNFFRAYWWFSKRTFETSATCFEDVSPRKLKACFISDVTFSISFKIAVLDTIKTQRYQKYCWKCWNCCVVGNYLGVKSSLLRRFVWGCTFSTNHFWEVYYLCPAEFSLQSSSRRQSFRKHYIKIMKP